MCSLKLIRCRDIANEHLICNELMLIIHIYRTNFPDNFNVLQSKMSEAGCGGRNTDT